MFDTPHPLSAGHPPGRASGPDLVADAGAGARSLVESGRIHLHQGRTDEALACCAAALRLKPEDAEAHRLRADALFRCRRIAAALASYDEALRCGLDPGEAVPERWMSWMLLGAFERAWEISDQVLRRRAPANRNRPDQPFHLRSVWDGSPLAGRVVLVRCYHGLGDTIQFIRYAPLLRRQAAAVVVQAQAELLPLLASVPGIDRLVPLDYGAPDPAFEVDIESMELPHALCTTLGTIPADIPYLRIDPARVESRRRKLGRGRRLRVGLVWAAGPWDERRSVPLAQFARLNAIPGLALVCLQRGPALTQVRERTGSAAVPQFVRLDEHGEAGDGLDTAATILALDLVISVDTMVAHLAGALGVPVWTLLHHGSDWRWLLDREDSPWYPTMRLFRQPAPGDWETPVAQVAARLAVLAGAAAPGCDGSDARRRV